jgi:hypothetical protein
VQSSCVVNLLTTRVSKTKTEGTSEKRLLWLRTCDHITAVLLIMETIHAVTTWRSESYEKAQKLPSLMNHPGKQLLMTPFLGSLNCRGTSTSTDYTKWIASAS